MQSVSRVVLRFTFVARALISLAIALMLANAPPTFIGIGVPFLAFAFADSTGDRDGLAGIVTRWLHQRLGRNVLSLALVIASVASAALGVAAVFMPPNAGLAKQLLLVSVLLQGLALLLPAAYSWPSGATMQRA